MINVGIDCVSSVIKAEEKAVVFLEVDSVVSCPSLAPVCILLFKNILFNGHVDTGKEREGETNWENRTDIYTHTSS